MRVVMFDCTRCSLRDALTMPPSSTTALKMRRSARSMANPFFIREQRLPDYSLSTMTHVAYHAWNGSHDPVDPAHRGHRHGGPCRRDGHRPLSLPPAASADAGPWAHPVAGRVARRPQLPPL